MIKEIIHFVLLALIAFGLVKLTFFFQCQEIGFSILGRDIKLKTQCVIITDKEGN